MGDQQAEQERAVRALLKAMERARDAVATIDGSGSCLPGGPASRLAATLHRVSDESARLRCEVALRLHESGLSIAEVAGVLGVSKSRAAQLISQARRGQ